MARRPPFKNIPIVEPAPLPEGMQEIVSMIQTSPTRVLLATRNALYKIDPTDDEPVVKPVKLKF